MKFIKWKSLIITNIVCLLPIFLGLAVWDKLPTEMAIHFNIYNEPDNFASREFAVLGLPALMVLLQTFCCFTNDINAHKHGQMVKFERVTKWIIPIMTIILEIITIGYNLGWNVDIRIAASLIVGAVLIVSGNYMPKLDYVKNVNVDGEKARKINRFLGFETVTMGILFLVSIFFEPIAAVVCLLLLIPYIIVGIIYSAVVIRKK